MVPKANALHAKYADEGLLVLGVTREEIFATQSWAADKGVSYGYAFDREGLSAALGVRGLPRAVLVDPRGVVVWRGRPADLTSDLIQATLRTAIDVPMWEWPEEAQVLREAILAGDTSRALGLASSLNLPEIRGVEELLAVQVEQDVARLDALVADDDVLGAIELATELLTQLDGLPQAQGVGEIAEHLATEPRLIAIAEDQREFRKAEDLWPVNAAALEDMDSSMVEAALERIRAIVPRYATEPPTPPKAPARQGAAAVERLESLMDLF